MKGKVLVVGHISKTHGGVSRFQEDLLKSQIEYQFVHFNIARPPKLRSAPAFGYDEVVSAGLRRMVIGLVVTAYHVFKFPWVLLQERPMIVHIAAVTYWPFWESALYLLMSRIARVKVIFHMLAPFDVFYKKTGLRAQSWVRSVLRSADHLVCLSAQDQELMCRLVGNDRVALLRSNVILSCLSAANTDRRGRKQLNVLFVGGIDPFRKGIYDILKALPKVISELSNVCFTFTGGDNVHHALHTSLDPRYLPWVSYQGWIPEEEKGNLYRSADLLLLPSYEEGLPYVIIEAMAAGLPVVATPVGAVPEVIKEGVNGFLINQGDYGALAERIVRICRDEEIRLKMGCKNFDDANLLFVQDVIFQKLEDIYDQMLNGR